MDELIDNGSAGAHRDIEPQQHCDMGTPDGMSSVSKTGQCDEAQLRAIRGNDMLHQFEREVLIAKLAEVQLVSSDEVAFLEDQCQALTDELKQSAVDKSLLHERVVELEKELSDTRDGQPSSSTRRADMQGWATLLLFPTTGDRNSAPNRPMEHLAGNVNGQGSSVTVDESGDSSVRVWAELQSALLVLYSDPEQRCVLRWADISCTPVRAYGGDAKGQTFRFEIGGDALAPEGDEQRLPEQCWTILFADSEEYLAWHRALSTVPGSSACVEWRKSLNTLHAAPQVSSTPALVTSVAQFAGCVQEVDKLRATCASLDSEVQALKRNQNVERRSREPSIAEHPTESDVLLEAVTAENAHLREQIESGTKERALLKERVSEGVNKLRQSVVQERSQWVREKQELLRQIDHWRSVASDSASASQ